MEKIKIENFAGIRSMEFEFKSINVLIGPQGSGKSITIKLQYFFKSFFIEILESIVSEEFESELYEKQKKKFITFFPEDSWAEGDFKIIYTLDNTTIRIQWKNKQFIFWYSENLKQVITEVRKIYKEEKNRIPKDTRNSLLYERQIKESLEPHLKKVISSNPLDEQFFIPAGRSFFANLQKSIFSFLRDDLPLDPFLIEFGANYENLKRFYYNSIKSKKADKEFDEIVSQILNSKYIREDNKDFLVHNDNRKVNLANASSGQQEALPLVVMLKVLSDFYILRNDSIYIEEPEAHLSPIAQKAMVKLLARTFNTNPEIKIFVTTHSPYILASFNNLLQAGKLMKLKPDESENISKVVPKQEQIDSGLFTAYSLDFDKTINLIDNKSKLINQTILDSISSEIAEEFDKLLDIEFKK